jgi:hypothetical protein
VQFQFALERKTGFSLGRGLHLNIEMTD